MGIITITFEKASLKHKDIIFSWLEERHIKEFWDNTQSHKDDIINFIDGRKVPSNYAEGRYIYWIGNIDGNPYSMIMSIKEYPDEDRPQIKEDYISKTGSTYSLEYMIGNKEFYGKGLGPRTLEEFMIFLKKDFDIAADTFFIDPDVENSRARRVYAKAGFEYIGDFIMEGSGVFAGQPSYFMVKKI